MTEAGPVQLLADLPRGVEIGAQLEPVPAAMLVVGFFVFKAVRQDGG